MKRVLIVGAGKVGQDYAAHLHDVGVEVTVLCRGHQRDDLVRRGLQYLTRGNQVEVRRLSASQLVASIDDVNHVAFDAVIACVRSEQRNDVGALWSRLKTTPSIAAFAFPVWPRSSLDFLPAESKKAFLVPRIFAFRGPFDPSSTSIECMDPGARPLAETLHASALRVRSVERLRESFAQKLVLGLPAIRALDEHSFRARAFANDRAAVERVLDLQEALLERMPEVSRPKIPPRFFRRRVLRNLDTLFSLGRRDIVESHVRTIAEQARTLLLEFESLYGVP